MRILLVAVVIVVAVGTSYAQLAPGWSRGQQDLKVEYEECRRRAPAALQAEGFRIDHDAGAFTVGIKAAHTAVVSCHPLAKKATAVNIVVASNGDGGGQLRERLQARMNDTGAAAPPPPPPPPPPSSPAANWSEWMDPDDQDGTGDWDMVTFPNEKVPCPRPSLVECRVKDGKRDWRQSGQRYTCSIDLGNGAGGGVCKNDENSGRCLDYEVRFGCSTGAHSRVPTIATGAGSGNWTPWLNRDDPGASADWEALADHKASVPCRPTAIECRTVKDKRDWRQTGQRYKCSLDEPNPGGICVNAENPGGCLDYEVRFRCD
jgi:hypothetical protein